MGMEILTSCAHNNSRQLTSDNDTPPSTPESRKGDVLLKTKVAIVKDVVAWVEVDGVRAADWKVDTTEVKLTLPAGAHRIVVNAIYQKKQSTIFDQQVTVVADAATPVDIPTK